MSDETPAPSDPLPTIAAAHTAALRLQQQLSTAASHRDALVRDALAAGTPATQIAAALDVDRQRIYQMAKTTVYRTIVDGTEYTGRTPLDVATAAYGAGVIALPGENGDEYTVIEAEKTYGGHAIIARLHITRD